MFRDKVTIKGFGKGPQVFINGYQITPKRSRKVRELSEVFEWGNGGQGADQLALAILLELSNEKIALANYESFKWFFLQPLLPGDNFVIVFHFGNWLKIKDEVSYSELAQVEA